MSLSCPRCGRAVDPASAFCGGCGQPLRPAPTERRCTRCGTGAGPTQLYCGQCGAPLPRGGVRQPPPLPPQDPRAAAPAPWVAQRRPRRLVALRQDGRPGGAWPIGREPVLCGRTAGDVVLSEDPTVSPLHARIEPRSDAVYVVDLGSLNGTFVRVTAPRPLSPGDELRIGHQLLRVEPFAERPAPSGPLAWGAADPGYRARLVQLMEGGGTGEAFPLLPGENSIGREGGRITFPGDRFVSARHARIDLGPHGVTVADAGSANGTFVRIGGAEPLAPGAELLVGLQLLRLE